MPGGPKAVAEEEEGGASVAFLILQPPPPLGALRPPVLSVSGLIWKEEEQWREVNYSFSIHPEILPQNTGVSSILLAPCIGCIHPFTSYSTAQSVQKPCSTFTVRFSLLSEGKLAARPPCFLRGI